MAIWYVRVLQLSISVTNSLWQPHNGVGSHLDFIQGTFDVFGMSADLSGFLTVVGGTLDGDGLSWSIGGPVNSALSLGGLLGQPQGISGYVYLAQEVCFFAEIS